MESLDQSISQVRGLDSHVLSQLIAYVRTVFVRFCPFSGCDGVLGLARLDFFCSCNQSYGKG